jgi:hypothetical protein
MADFHPQCPKCGKTMDRGHIPDAAYGMVLQAAWASGDPEARRFIGGIKYRREELIPLSAYRCATCGLVELYAREP